MGRGVAPIRERMDHDALAGEPFLLREPEERVQVLLAAVDAPVRDEPEEVEAATRCHRFSRGRRERGVRRELALLDGEVDAREHLVDDTARADVHVPDLAVAHLPLGEADGEAYSPGRAERCARLRERGVWPP